MSLMIYKYIYNMCGGCHRIGCGRLRSGRAGGAVRRRQRAPRAAAGCARRWRRWRRDAVWRQCAVGSIAASSVLSRRPKQAAESRALRASSTRALLSYRVLVLYHNDIAPVSCEETTWKRTHFSFSLRRGSRTVTVYVVAELATVHSHSIEERSRDQKAVCSFNPAFT